MLNAVEPLAVDALLLDGADDALDHSVLLRAMRGDELLLQAIAADKGEPRRVCRMNRPGFAGGWLTLVTRPWLQFPELHRS